MFTPVPTALQIGESPVGPFSLRPEMSVPNCSTEMATAKAQLFMSLPVY